MLKLYNTLSRTIEEFTPLNPPHVGMYSCGPTVYDYQHIGHMRRYVGDDILVRVLRMNDYDVKHVMNITDVGHLVSDSDTGEDKMEKGAKKFGLSVWEIAKKFEKQFFDSAEALNIQRPDVVLHATECIADQIELIKILEEKGYTYVILDGVYFDTSKFADYAKLSGQNLAEVKPGARVEMVPGKKNPTDFALWKFSPKEEKRDMEWESPWGKGFPGWHVECSTMSMSELGPTIDIHTGGIDHIPIHHTNEIAQSEAASGKQFVRYWVHHNFLMVDGQKMSKSLGNLFTVQDVRAKSITPLALRYLYLQTHYRQEMNFTWGALESAQKSLKDLWEVATVFGKNPDIKGTEREPSQKVIKQWEAFEDALNNDLATSVALATLYRGIKESTDDFDLIFFLSRVDAVFGLDLAEKGRDRFAKASMPIPQDILDMVEERERLRKQKSFHQADQLRNKIENFGYEVEDVKDDHPRIIKK